MLCIKNLCVVSDGVYSVKSFSNIGEVTFTRASGVGVSQGFAGSLKTSHFLTNAKAIA